MKRILVLATAFIAASAVATAQQTPPAAPQPVTPQWTGPEVTLQTTMGDIFITLDTVGAPKTSAQFLGLVKSGHYNGAAFYRIEPGYLVQLGDLDAKHGYRAPKLPPVPLETETNRHARGAVGLAHADDPNSGQSTFYIDLAENSGLNATPGAPPNTTGYAAFGHVTAGMEVAEAIGAVERAPEGGPFPGKLPKVPVVVNKAAVTKEQAQ
ncbi:MAG: peptidylprolyl isomerase [Hyphomonadaceae bacterium]|nr:peptidylprolyl isomerase [Hyphomonadaceae bacterium]